MEISLYRKLLESEEDRLGMATGGFINSYTVRQYSGGEYSCQQILARNILAEDSLNHFP